MMAYQVLTADNGTVIADIETGLRVRVNEKDLVVVAQNTAYCLATLYCIKGGFIPDKIFVFRALTKTGLEALKNSVDFFFTTLLETELYVKEVPPDSALFPEEAARLYGFSKEDLNNGTVGIIYGSGAK